MKTAKEVLQGLELNLTQETLEPTKTEPTTQKSLSAEPNKDAWSAKWLKLDTRGHPDLHALRDEAFRFCSEAWKNPQVGRLLVLAGGNGNGKTHTAKRIANWVWSVGRSNQFMPRPNYVKSMDCIFWSWPSLLDSLKRGAWEIIDDCMDVSVLILDELGGGHDPSMVGVDKLCQILSHREKQWTIVTTNIAPEAWEDVFDKRVASRLLRNSTIVDLSNVTDYSTTR